MTGLAIRFPNWEASEARTNGDIILSKVSVEVAQKRDDQQVVSFIESGVNKGLRQIRENANSVRVSEGQSMLPYMSSAEKGAWKRKFVEFCRI